MPKRLGGIIGYRDTNKQRAAISLESSQSVSFRFAAKKHSAKKAPVLGAATDPLLNSFNRYSTALTLLPLVPLP